jgi:hypothetical protein
VRQKRSLAPKRRGLSIFAICSIYVKVTLRPPTMQNATKKDEATRCHAILAYLFDLCKSVASAADYEKCECARRGRR